MNDILRLAIANCRSEFKNDWIERACILHIMGGEYEAKCVITYNFTPGERDFQSEVRPEVEILSVLLRDTRGNYANISHVFVAEATRAMEEDVLAEIEKSERYA